MKLISTAFNEGGQIPSKYTCDGENINPPLSWRDIPSGTKSFALIMDDPDIPDFVKKARGIEVFDHWTVFNILPLVSNIEEGIEPEGVAGLNSGGKLGYIGSCPPDQEHRYFFRLYALDKLLDLSQGTSKHGVLSGMEGHILDVAELMGKYKRIN